MRRPARKLSLFDARGHPRDEISSGFSKPQNSLRNEVRPVFNLKDGYFHTSGGQKSKIEDNHAKVEEAFREEAEKHYSIIDNMVMILYKCFYLLTYLIVYYTFFHVNLPNQLDRNNIKYM